MDSGTNIFPKNSELMTFNVPAVRMLLVQQYQGFGSPDKQMRSICRTDKMRVE
jgi:hypothetical protein